jgi:hypothetical protein
MFLLDSLHMITFILDSALFGMVFLCKLFALYNLYTTGKRKYSLSYFYT